MTPVDVDVPVSSCKNGDSSIIEESLESLDVQDVRNAVKVWPMVEVVVRACLLFAIVVSPRNYNLAFVQFYYLFFFPFFFVSSVHRL